MECTATPNKSYSTCGAQHILCLNAWNREFCSTSLMDLTSSYIYNVPITVKILYNKAIIQQKCIQGTLPLNISERAPAIT